MKTDSKIVLGVAMMLIAGGFLGIIVTSDNELSAADLPSDAIAVSTPADLARIGKNIDYGGYLWSPNAYYYIANDITLTGKNNFVPIGTEAVPFNGTIDGRGNTISGMNMDGEAHRLALIATAANVTIKDLTIDKFSVVSDSALATYSSGFISNTNANAVITVTGCAFTNSVIDIRSPNSAASGFVTHSGTNATVTVSDCWSNSNISVNSTANQTKAGGIVGSVTTANVSNCYNTGNITITNTDAAYNSLAGGIAAALSAGTVSECFNTGTVSADVSAAGTSSFLGGIAGHTTGIATIKDCYNTGDIVNINASTAEGSVYVVSGGIAGYAQSGNLSIINCYSVGSISDTSDRTIVTGGIIGSILGGGKIVNSYYLAGMISKNGVIAPDLMYKDGTPTVDGTSDPARLSFQSSGAKTAEQMTAPLTSMQAGISVFYTGTTTADSTAITGWDFEETWTTNANVNGGFPTLVNTVAYAADADADEGKEWDNIVDMIVENIVVVVFGLIMLAGVAAYALGLRRPLVVIVTIASLVIAVAAAWLGGLF